MASEAQINQKKLDDELAKRLPDYDIVYFLKTTRPYWNTVDVGAMKRGQNKHSKLTNVVGEKVCTRCSKGKQYDSNGLCIKCNFNKMQVGTYMYMLRNLAWAELERRKK